MRAGLGFLRIGMDREMTRSNLVLATIVSGSTSSDVALFQSDGFRVGTPSVHCLVVGEEFTEMPGSAVRWRLDQLSLPSSALRFAMDPSEVATLVKPRFLLLLARSEPKAHVLFVDETCLMRRQPSVLDVRPEGAIQLFAGLDDTAARRFPTFSQALSAGLGQPTGDVIGLRNTHAETDAILDEWDRWMFHRYLSDPTTRLRNDEAGYLASLPGSRRAVSWGDQSIYVAADSLDCLKAAAIVGTRDRVDFSSLAPLAFASTDVPSAVLDGRIDRVDEAIEPDPFEALAQSVFRAVDPMGHRWREPPDDFHEWLRERDPHGLPRSSRSAYWTREDLRASFPPRATSTEVFNEWFDRVALDRDVPNPSRSVIRRSAAAIDRLSRRASRRAVPALATSRRSNPDAVGINVVGYLDAATGLGSAARSTQKALSGLPIQLASLDLSDRILTGRVQRDRTPIEGMPFDISIIHLNPEELIGYATDSLAFRLGTGWNIGFFFWETDRIPDSWVEGIDAIDEIWVGSAFVANAFRAATSKAIHIVGLPVEPVDEFRAERGGVAAFAVSYVADLGSGAVRKNPLAVVDAFRIAFGSNFDGVRLTMKLGNLKRFPDLRSQLYTYAREMPLDIIDGYLESGQVRSLMGESDAYVSLHHSEGLGLTMIEAMDLGVPVVATGYGGNMDFMSDDSACLVEFSMVTAGPNAGPYAGHRWAEPDIDHAADHLRALRANTTLRGEMGERGREIAKTRYSPEAFRNRLATALDRSSLTSQ